MKGEMEVLESLKCPVCLDYADEPMECQHCSNIFCRKCLGIEGGNIKMKSCPMCRKEPSFKESAFAKRLLSNIPVACPNECGATTSKTELNAHLLKCPKKIFTCLVCNFQSMKEDFMMHVTTKHEEEILNKFAKEEGKDKEITPCKTYTNSNGLNTNAGQGNNKEGVGVNNKSNFENRAGNKVVKGDNGKFYCGKKLGFNCGCCDGNCGPENGCCCPPCMDFNCSIRSLPAGMLVNNKGLPSKFTRLSYYCACEYEKESNNILRKVFKKRIKCEYPQEACTNCTILNKIMINYFSKNELNRIIQGSYPQNSG